MHYYNFCYYTVITSSLHIITYILLPIITFSIITLLLHHIITSYYYIISLHCYYIILLHLLLQTHYYSLLRHYYVNITLLLRHYYFIIPHCKNGNNERIITYYELSLFSLLHCYYSLLPLLPIITCYQWGNLQMEDVIAALEDSILVELRTGVCAEVLISS